MNAPRTPAAAPQATLAAPTLLRTPPPLRAPATLAPAVRTPATSRPAAPRPKAPTADSAGGWLDGPRRHTNAVLSADVPGWDLLTTLVGYNPVLGHEVRRDMGLIAHRLLHLEHTLGPRLYQRLMADGFLPKLIHWVEEHTRDIHITVPALKQAFEQAWEDTGFLNSTAENMEAVKQAFTPLLAPIMRLGTELMELLAGWLREAVLTPLATRAQQHKGYKLLTLGLGFDPISHAPVEQNADNLGHALLGLLPGGEERYQHFKQARVLERLPAWLTHELARRQLSTKRLQALVAHSLDQLHQLSWEALLAPVQTAVGLAKPYLDLAFDVMGMLVSAELALLKLLVEAVLGDKAHDLFKLLDQAGDLLMRILRNPLPFLRTLVTAGKEGFMAFLHNAPDYLQQAAQKWLFGPLAAEHLDVPKVWNVPNTLHLLLQVLGLTKQHVMEQLEAKVRASISPEAAERIQQIGGPLLTLLNEGPGALWKEISAQAGNLVTQAFDAVEGQLTKMLTKGITLFLAKLAIPGGAIVQVLNTTYDVYQTVVARAQQLAEVGRTLFRLASSLEQGNTALAAKAIEKVLSDLLPVALDFLARTFGLDKLPKLLRIGLQALRTPIDKGIDWVLTKIIDFARAAWEAIKKGGKAVGQAGRDAVGTVKGWLGLQERVFLPNNETHTLYFSSAGTLLLASQPKPLSAHLKVLDRHKQLFINEPEKSQVAALVNRIKELDEQVTAQRTQDKPDEAIISVLLQELATAITALLRQSTAHWLFNNEGKLTSNMQEELVLPMLHEAHATQLLPSSGRPGTAGAMLFPDGKIITAHSQRGNNGRLPDGLHDDVVNALKNVPQEEQSAFHGQCAEIQIISEARKRGKSLEDIRGALSLSADVSGENNPKHTRPKCACSSCNSVLKQLGITDVVRRESRSTAGE